MAGEKSVAINRAWERWPNIDTEAVAEMVAAGFDAGRASRDAEVEALEDKLADSVPKSWGGLFELLNEAYPEDIFPTLPDDASRDQGPRVISLIRLLDRERDRAEAAEAVIAAIADRHKPRNGESPRYAEDDYDHEREPIAWEKYTICDYDKTAWPCATQKLISAAPQTVLAERIAQAKAEALKEAALDLWRDESAGPGTTKATYNAIYATWLEQRATTVRAAVSHPEPTEERFEVVLGRDVGH